MRAAQNTADSFGDMVARPLGGVTEMINQLPGWLRAVVVVILVLLLVARVCVPPVLRAIDDHLLIRRAREKITGDEHWVEVLRIRNEPRRLLGLRDKPDSQTSTSAPQAANATEASAPDHDRSSDDPP